MTKVQEQQVLRVTSKDGSSIAYERSGEGAPVILVAAALADRTGTRRLAKALAPEYTVINFDRRGRNDSTEHEPYDVQREVDDIEALIDAAGGQAVLFGSSSGSVLALDAANRLGDKVSKVVLFEPPFIVDDSREPMPADLDADVRKLIDEQQPGAVVKLFMHKAMGIPKFAVNIMSIMPGWSSMRAAAHTLPHDLELMRGTQDGTPLPAERWKAISAPVLVLTGGRSEQFFHRGGDALVEVLADGRHEVLKGQGHGVVLMNPKALLPQFNAFVEG
ncbi:alpha/beta fold hydrolase [Dactylosporangium sp. CS-033363]|uniref:alpha/beta fold hydrolase n=1 Tax=Dactylosporangium sp. CS-033363 TaxID=3239935 RepID=UPI003D92D043